ncbi:hypothetical protein [Roseimaritima sediminicola]|uniref:hypothetical protein n=1 Tax=Roseimaritima sediminicola TaxID=2662066 RepID=UPI001298589B|nr:hypothetical protein [Roseimaritima sediminicola]
MTHSDKPAAVTESVHGPTPAMRRGWWVLFALGLLAVGVVGAALSVKLRRTQTEHTSQFFGEDAVAALQSSRHFRLTMPPLDEAGEAEPTEAEFPEDAAEPVDLADIPGVSHLRRALLDQRSYDWDTRRSEDIDSLVADSAPSARWATIVLDGEVPHRPPITPTTFRLDLTNGWVGVPGRSGSVRLTGRVQRAVRSKLSAMYNVEG